MSSDTPSSASSSTSGHKGRIHSIETGGMVDGPGVRFVVFTQGCPLKCLYCHNPDSKSTHEGREITVDELMVEILKYKTFMEFSHGGVTMSGGEPLLQHEFVKEVFHRCKDNGIHTSLDTSGYVNLKHAASVLDYTDLVTLCLKAYDEDLFKKVAGVSRGPSFHFLEYLNEINKPTWIRYVLVPQLTDSLEDVEKMAQVLSPMKNIEKVEILPFHKTGEFKWESLGYNYQLKNTPPPTDFQINTVANIFKKYHLKVS